MRRLSRLISRDPLTSPLAAGLLALAAIAPLWVVIPVALVAVGLWGRHGWDNRKL